MAKNSMFESFAVVKHVGHNLSHMLKGEVKDDKTPSSGVSKTQVCGLSGRTSHHSGRQFWATAELEMSRQACPPPPGLYGSIII